MAKIDELLNTVSTEELEAMTDEQLREYFKEAISLEPKIIGKPLVKDDKKSAKKPKTDEPIKIRKNAKHQTLEEIENELKNLGEE